MNAHRRQTHHRSTTWPSPAIRPRCGFPECPRRVSPRQFDMARTNAWPMRSGKWGTNAWKLNRSHFSLDICIRSMKIYVYIISCNNYIYILFLYVYTNTHTHTHIYIYIYIYASQYSCMNMMCFIQDIYIYIYTCVFFLCYIHMYDYLFIALYVCVMWIYIYIYIYVYISNGIAM